MTFERSAHQYFPMFDPRAQLAHELAHARLSGRHSREIRRPHGTYWCKARKLGQIVATGAIASACAISGASQASTLNFDYSRLVRTNTIAVFGALRSLRDSSLRTGSTTLLVDRINR